MTATVLLTAAITPHPDVDVALHNPQDRLEQYKSAFSWWADAALTYGFRLAVVEASGTEVAVFSESLSAVPASQLTILSCESQSSGERGKGALEAALIDRSVAMLDLDDDDALYKVTGRLVIANAGKVFRELPPASVVARGLLNQSRIDMRCVGASISVWKTVFARMDEDVDERINVHLGHAMALRTLQGEIDGSLNRMRFEHRPEIRGTSGTVGKKYGSVLNRVSERVGARAESLLVKLAQAKSV